MSTSTPRASLVALAALAAGFAAAVDGARGAPFIPSALRDGLAGAAEFASAATAELTTQADEAAARAEQDAALRELYAQQFADLGAIAANLNRIAELHEQTLAELRQQTEASTAAEAAMLDKLAELEARLSALENPPAEG
ncbi:hypothetical protein [Roseateles violae]|uniref:Uncharacterized protein n=1 Tax=Roseateles violae TaxID=3058042 RepID=A0ABT8E0F8_9BURK|nr:hypothetical protein [Pelomonas sp. PFR6]MDN3923336.1 hypothetical protein [Pelomonas sp. PFR6]